jgi:hypothetical protein
MLIINVAARSRGEHLNVRTFVPGARWRHRLLSPVLQELTTLPKLGPNPAYRLESNLPSVRHENPDLPLQKSSV